VTRLDDGWTRTEENGSIVVVYTHLLGRANVYLLPCCWEWCLDARHDQTIRAEIMKHLLSGTRCCNNSCLDTSACIYSRLFYKLSRL